MQLLDVTRLDYQPLFGKGAHAPPPNVLLGEGRGPDTRERRKSSLGCHKLDMKPNLAHPVRT